MSLVEKSGVRPSYDEFEKMATDMFDAFKLIHENEKRKTKNAWRFCIFLVLLFISIVGLFILEMKGINLIDSIKQIWN
jgi:hypothetical protein